MNDRLFFEADCRELNRKAALASPDANKTQAEKLLDRVFPQNHKAPPLKPDLPIFRSLAETIHSMKEQVNWEQDLTHACFVVFDTETTGLHPFKGDEIISLGAVMIENGRIQPQPVYEQLINPLRSISAQSKKITGITEEMLQGQPTICGALLEFLKFAGPRILVAHNAPFDLAFLNLKIGEAIGTRIVNPVIDTVLLASALYPSLGDYSLENLAPRFNFNLEGRHSALGDARITAALFLQLLPRLFAEGITTLPLLAQLFAGTPSKSGYPLIF
jgi:DNA polymerase III subunit epsilon